MNIPYVKKYDTNGVLTNPIKDFYASREPNRRERRRREPRFMNNRRGVHLYVLGIRKFRLLAQRIDNKVIKQYLEN